MTPAARVPAHRHLGQLALVAMVAAVALLAAREATRAELRQCHGLITSVMTEAPAGVRAVAAAIAAVVRDLRSPDRESDHDQPPALPASGLRLKAADSSEPAPPWDVAARVRPSLRLLPGQLDLPPPLA